MHIETLPRFLLAQLPTNANARQSTSHAARVIDPGYRLRHDRQREIVISAAFESLERQSSQEINLKNFFHQTAYFTRREPCSAGEHDLG